MPDEIQAPDQGSPDAGHVADPAVDPGTSTAIDWESDDNPYRKRFNDYRSEADRKATRLSQYEQAVEDFRTGDPERMRQAAQALQLDDFLEFEESEEPTYDDPSEYAVAEVQSLRAEMQREREEAVINEVESRLETLVPGSDEDEDVQRERKAILAFATTLPPLRNGAPPVDKALDILKARDQAKIDAAMKEWRKTKRPSTAGIAPGQAATQQPNVAELSREERQKFMAQRFADAEAQE